MHGPIIHFESIGREVRKLDGLERRRREILHAAASDAVEMMMASSAKLEARPPARMRDAARELKLDQGLQHAVHRCARNAGHSLAHGLEQVFGARVILARRQGLKDGPPLYRHRKTPLSASLLESAESVLDLVSPTVI